MIQYTRDATWSELRGVRYSDVEEKMERAPRGDVGVNVEESQGTAGSRLDGLIPNKSKTFPQPPQKSDLISVYLGYSEQIVLSIVTWRAPTTLQAE